MSAYGYAMTNYDLQAVAIMLTGLVKAFELHADANPRAALTLRGHADNVRGHRDTILKEIGLRPGTVLDDHGGASEWTAAIKQIAYGSSEWGPTPSRDEWLSTDQAPDSFES